MDQLKAVKQDLIPLPLSKEYLRKLEEEEQTNGSGAVANGWEESEVEQPQRQGIETVTQEQIVKEGKLMDDKLDHRATFPDTPIRPTEKRKVSPFHVLYL